MTTPPRYFRRVIAIDGPAASGKSSVAHQLAHRIGFMYVNSGAMYRAMTWHVLDRGIDLSDDAAIGHLAEEANLVCDLAGGDSVIHIDGIDPTPHLREVRVNSNVSRVSSVGRVREVLVAHMHAYAVDHDVVMEGRDIGSVVFPHTPYKFYVDARPEIRAQRRAAQGQTDRIEARDRADSSRRDSPLMVASDAFVIDSSELDIDSVVNEIVARLLAKGLSLPANVSALPADEP